LEGIEVPEQAELLSRRSEAVKAEEALVAELTELGVKMGDWTPAMSMKAPKGKPAVAVDGALKAVAMRSVAKLRRAGAFRGDKVLPTTSMIPEIATPARAPVPMTPISYAPAMEVDAEVKAQPRGMKRLHGKTRMGSAGDIE